MINLIKESVKQLFKKDQVIHIHFDERKYRNIVRDFDIVAKIQSVYKSIFTIVEYNVENPKSYSIQYSEILTRDIVISEIGVIPEQPKIK